MYAVVGGALSWRKMSRSPANFAVLCVVMGLKVFMSFKYIFAPIVPHLSLKSDTVGSMSQAAGSVQDVDMMDLNALIELGKRKEAPGGE
eukprot:4664061-Pyramimonas_sp.AAC.1